MSLSNFSPMFFPRTCREVFSLSLSLNKKEKKRKKRKRGKSRQACCALQKKRREEKRSWQMLGACGVEPFKARSLDARRRNGPLRVVRTPTNSSPPLLVLSHFYLGHLEKSNRAPQPPRNLIYLFYLLSYPPQSPLLYATFLSCTFFIIFFSFTVICFVIFPCFSCCRLRALLLEYVAI